MHNPSMPSSVASAAPAPRDLAWRVVGLVNLYRLLVPPMLLAIFWAAEPQSALLPPHPTLFLSICIAYFSAAVLLVAGAPPVLADAAAYCAPEYSHRLSGDLAHPVCLRRRLQRRSASCSCFR